MERRATVNEHVLSQNTSSCRLLGYWPANTSYFQGRIKEEDRIRQSLFQFMQPRAQVALTIYGEAGTGKTCLVSDVLKSKFPDRLNIGTIFWHNCTDFRKDNFFEEFGEEMGIEAKKNAKHRFQEALKALDKTVLIVFDDIYEYNFDEVCSVFTEASSVAKGNVKFLCIARKWRSDSLMCQAHKVGQIEIQEIEDLLRHELQRIMPDLSDQFISEAADKINKASCSLVLWVSIVISHLRQLRSERAMNNKLDRYLASKTLGSEHHGSTSNDILLEFDQQSDELRKLCYAILAFGEATLVEIAGLAVLLNWTVDRTWENVHKLHDCCLIRFREEDRNECRGIVNIHDILFKNILDYATSKEKHFFLLQITKGLSKQKTTKKNIECLVVNFVSLFDNILHRIIDQRRSLLLRTVVDTLLMTNNFERLFVLMEYKMDGKPACLKWIEAQNWREGPAPLNNQNFGLTVLVEAFENLVCFNERRAFELRIFQKLCQSCQSTTRTIQYNNAAFIAAKLKCAKVLHHLFEYTGTQSFINNQDEDGNTCLHFVIQSPSCCKALVSKGADATIRNDFGDVPIVEAAYCESGQCLKAIISNSTDIDVNCQNSRGISAIVASLIPPPGNREGFDFLLSRPEVDVSCRSNSLRVSCFDICTNLGNGHWTEELKSKRPNDDHTSMATNPLLMSLLLQLKGRLSIGQTEGKTCFNQLLTMKLNSL